MKSSNGWAFYTPEVDEGWLIFYKCVWFIGVMESTVYIAMSLFLMVVGSPGVL